MTYPISKIAKNQNHISIDHQSRILDFSGFNMDDDTFFDFCQKNDHLRIERNADGTIIFMPPTGTLTGERNSEIGADLVIWKRKNGGHSFDSSTGFTLNNTAVRSPDASWMSNERYSSVELVELKKFARICPEFVVELMSENDLLSELQKKMEEYIENGVLLGWLVNPKTEEVFIYREDGTIAKVIGFNNKLSGENILKGFEFDLNLLRL
ncbi:MAG: Uma2 family endonuclease [Arcicella sp.]|nr:Uma2 family endonuclease [Arcicella sp.]